VTPQVIFRLFVLFAGAVLPNVTRDILKKAISLLETENPSVSILFNFLCYGAASGSLKI
jgi:Fe-S oxidoreductase